MHKALKFSRDLFIFLGLGSLIFLMVLTIAHLFFAVKFESRGYPLILFGASALLAMYFDTLEKKMFPKGKANPVPRKAQVLIFLNTTFIGLGIFIFLTSALLTLALLFFAVTQTKGQLILLLYLATGVLFGFAHKKIEKIGKTEFPEFFL